MSRHGFSPRNGDATPPGDFGLFGKYGRLFPDVPPLCTSQQALTELGEAMIEVAPGAARLHPYLPAGYAYLGQFVDHDVTFDPTTFREVRVDPFALRNFRTPALDLDSLYGGGPDAQPSLYQRDENWLFMPGLTNANAGTDDPTVPPYQVHDLPRTLQGFAVIADPRNDENLIVAQLHLAFLRFHNRVAEQLGNGSIARQFPELTLFEEARRLVVWHYQWIVLEDFLPSVLDPTVLACVRARGSLLTRICASRGCGAYIPVEFSAAAYRFGHTMVNSEYDYNRVFNRAKGRPASLTNLFDLTGRRGSRAHVPIPSDWIIDWRRFFAIDSGMQPNLSGLLDPYLATGLARISHGPGEPVFHLAVRNLQRGNSLGLPSAQAVAKALDCEPTLKPAAIAVSGADGEAAARHGLHEATPLWYYILKEAQLARDGERLGPLGSRLVAEVFVGLLETDSSSFLAYDPGWKPTLAGPSNTFTVADLLQYAGDINPLG